MQPQAFPDIIDIFASQAESLDSDVIPDSPNSSSIPDGGVNILHDRHTALYKKAMHVPILFLATSTEGSRLWAFLPEQSMFQPEVPHARWSG